MFAARNIHYDIADRTRAIGHGGIGSLHVLARKVGLIDAIDRDLELLKVHLTYHESDHVLNIAPAMKTRRSIWSGPSSRAGRRRSGPS